MDVRTTSIDQAAAVLAQGKPIVFPTETVYGLGVAVGAAQSPRQLYDIKCRQHEKPIAWLVASQDDLTRYGKLVPEFVQAIARTFWPGPLTLVVRAADCVPEGFRSQAGTIGLRMPNNQTTLDLIKAIGSPLATTSANLAGLKAPGTSQALDPQLLNQVECALIDADDQQKSGIASTILDCTQDHPVVLREGAITITEILARA